MPAWGCCKPFYDPFYRHEKYDGKLYEVDRGRRRGLHLYLHRIYFTTVDASSKTLAGSSRCTRGGHREGESSCDAFLRGPSFVVMVGRIVFVSERPKVNPITAV